MKFFVTILIFILFNISCASNTSDEKTEDNDKTLKYDVSSSEYQLANILCECFDNFEENDVLGQFDVIECFSSKINDTSLNDTDAIKTQKILKDICPESSKKFEEWQEKMEGN